MALKKKEPEDPAEFVARKDFKKAAALYRERVAKQPKNATLRLSLADTLLMANQADEAIREYKEVGALYTEDGFLVKAIAIYKKILKLRPGDRDVEAFLEHLSDRRGMDTSRGRTAPVPAPPPPARQKPEPAPQAAPQAAPPPARPAPAPPPQRPPAPTLPPPPVIELEPDVPIIDMDDVPVIDLFEPEAPPVLEIETHLFRDLAPEEFQSIVAKLTLRHYEEDTIVVQEGDPGDSLFIVVRGQVRVLTHDNRNKEIVLANLGEGEFFGEVALLTERPRTATIITNLNTELLELTRDDYNSLIARYPNVKTVMEEFHHQRAYKTIEAMIQSMRENP